MHTIRVRGWLFELTYQQTPCCGSWPLQGLVTESSIGAAIVLSTTTNKHQQNSSCPSTKLGIMNYYRNLIPNPQFVQTP